MRYVNIQLRAELKFTLQLFHIYEQHVYQNMIVHYFMEYMPCYIASLFLSNSIPHLFVKKAYDVTCIWVKVCNYLQCNFHRVHVDGKHFIHWRKKLNIQTDMSLFITEKKIKNGMCSCGIAYPNFKVMILPSPDISEIRKRSG